MCREIVTKEGVKLKPDKMADFGNVKDYLAYVGGCVYVKVKDDLYELLEKK